MVQNIQNTGQISLFDAPNIARKSDQTDFETYILLTNYDNSGKDLIVGMVQWGFTADENQQVTPKKGQPKVIPTNQFSDMAQKAVAETYHNYQPYVENK